MNKVTFLIILILLFQSKILFSEEFPLVRLNNIFDIKDKLPDSEKGLVIFSSRYYIDFLKTIKPQNAEIYWVVPVDEVTVEELDGLKKLYTDLGRKIEVEERVDGIVVKENGIILYTLLPFTQLHKIVLDRADVIVDVDFFFRRYIKSIAEINNEKTLEIIKFYRSLEDYEIIPDTIYIVLSRDISLPDWVEQFGYILERVYKNFREKIFPETLYLLDEVGKYINFGLYDDAYETLLNIFPEEIENPYFYEKMMVVASKLLIFDDMLKAFEEGYKRNSHIITLIPEVVNYLLDKEHFYPAYLLAKSAKEKEVWNKEINNLLTDIIVSGYKFYNRLEEDTELYKFFKEEYKKLKK